MSTNEPEGLEDGSEGQDGPNRLDGSEEPVAISRKPSQIYSPQTSKLEVFGWCLYSWASEPFVVSAVGTYVPILLEQIARDNGVRLSDKTSPCRGSKHDPNSPYPPQQPPDESALSRPDSCVLPIANGRWYIDTSSYALYTFSVSVLIQTICVISMSGMADRGAHRKQLLIGFAVFGALSTMSYLFLRSDSYYMASFLAILCNSAYGCVSVCGNSFLSLLVQSTPEVMAIQPDDPEKTRKVGVMSAKISGAGAATGYVAALIVQFASIIILVAVRGKSKHVVGPIKVVLGVVGAWWLVFQLPISWFLKSRSSPELRLDHIQPPDGTPRGVARYKLQVLRAYIFHGYETLYLAFKQVSELRDICSFLIGWFILSDSLVTINSTAILYAKNNLDMNTIQLSRISVLAMISAITGSMIIPNYIQPRFGFSIKQMLVIVILWSTLIPLSGVLAIFSDSVGLHSATDMYIMSVVYGFSLGGVATLARSMFSMLVPPGQESTFFALFSITDKGSSILGPFLVGMVIDVTHDIRQCFWVLLGLLFIAAPIFYYCVDVERGIEEAAVLADDDN